LLSFLLIIIGSGCISFLDNNNENENEEYELNLETNDDLDSQEAEEIIETANNIYTKAKGESGEQFEIENRQFRYLSPPFDTEENLEQNLGEVFSKNYKEYIINKLGIFEHNDRLARPDMETEPLFEFNNPVVNLVENDNIKSDNSNSKAKGEEQITYRLEEQSYPGQESENPPALIQFLPKGEKWVIDEVIFKPEKPQIQIESPQEPSSEGPSQHDLNPREDSPLDE